MENLSVLMVLAGLGGLVGLVTLLALMLRRVVPTNEVHIVQSAKKTTSYGKDTNNGNTYYEWPSWIPLVGITKVKLPTSVFDLDLESYEAYDKGRLPFVVDVKAFFRITDSNVAAQRVASFAELHNQLKAIVQGAVRVILASNDIEEILQGRSTFGEQFTKEVAEQLANWGVSTVKNIELMDIRDSAQSMVIKNIMEKKKSHIEMESRTEVAKNKRIAQIAEIEAQKEVDIQKQDASQAVGLRTLEAQRQVELQAQSKEQSVKEAQKLTKEKEMEVLQVQHVRTAEINRKVSLVAAEQEKQNALIKAEQEKQTAVLRAEGVREQTVINANAQKEQIVITATAQLEATKANAEGITLESQAKATAETVLGTARAAAEKAMQLAPVEAQITLAKEIGANESYQKYLVTIRQVEASQAVGIQQAKALENADIKVISNAGSPGEGVTNVMDLFSAKGGTQLASMLEGLAQTNVGKALIEKVVSKE